MASVGPSFFTVPDRPPSRRVGPEIGAIVVWLWGEHDVSTDTALCLTLARAIAVGRAGVIVDLSGVEFMGASTLGVIARARRAPPAGVSLVDRAVALGLPPTCHERMRLERPPRPQPGNGGRRDRGGARLLGGSAGGPPAK